MINRLVVRVVHILTTLAYHLMNFEDNLLFPDFFCKIL